MTKRIATISLVWQQIAERLRRPGAIVGLFVVLLIGVIEPMTCIVHCSVLSLLAATTPGLTQHHHTAAAPMAAASSAETLQPLTDAHTCTQLQPRQPWPTSGSESAAPQPFHEMLLLAITLVIAALPFTRRKHLPNGPPTQWFAPTLGRPPIRCV